MKKQMGGLVLASLIVWAGYHSMASDNEEPLVVVTHVDVISKFTAEGRDLLHRFVADARKEVGAVRLEVFEEIGRPNHSTVVEVWNSRDAYETHLAANPTKAYRAKLQPMLGSPFDERLHHQIP